MKNFFEHQDAARRSTVKLVLLFGLAVVLIIVALYMVFLAAQAYLGSGAVTLWQPGLLAVTAVGGGAVIGLGSLTKTWSLRSGGSAVAEGLGGRLVDRETTDPDERQLMNVVEEMAIASGVPVPTVYLLDDEESINAFAAGYTPDDAVIGVTRGSVQMLDRDELQGVIAHEFSHILNGDMRINIRLIGILYGILVIGIIGRVLMQSAALGGYRRSRDRDSRGRLVIIMAGLALFVVGSAGFFCGRFIKSAVSRQREFLADASAVQFTRNPQGLAGALKKIGGFAQGSAIASSKAEENSHLFFGYALGDGLFANAFSTHPPLRERVHRIDPSFEGEFPPVETAEAEAMAVGLQGEALAASGHVTADPEQVVEQVGRLSKDHLAYGAAVREGLPEPVRRAAHEPFGAVAVAYGLLMDADETLREKQWTVLRAQCAPALVEETRRLLPPLEAMDRRARLPLVELAAPALHELSPAQHETFIATIQQLVEADERLSIFEFALQKILEHRLTEAGGQRMRYRRLNDVLPDSVTLLSALARVGHTRDDEVQHAFRAGLARFEGLDEEEQTGYEPGACSLSDINRALDRLRAAKPKLKQQAIDACAHCVLADRTVTIQEAELLRAIAIAADCPLPPFLPVPGEAT